MFCTCVVLFILYLVCAFLVSMLYMSVLMDVIVYLYLFCYQCDVIARHIKFHFHTKIFTIELCIIMQDDIIYVSGQLT